MVLRSEWWFAFIACIVLYGCRKDEPVSVAEVDGKKIVPEEFSTRFKSFLSEVNGKDNILLRKQILNNMINEQLIAEDVERQGLDRDSIAGNRLGDVHNQAILLCYARRITLDTMKITDQDLKQEYIAYTTKAAARYLYAPTEDEAWMLKDELERGATFDSLAKEIFQDPGLATNGGYLGYFGWGEMEPPLEEAAFTLPVGELSDPVKLRMGYAIVKVEHRVRQPLTSEADFAKVQDKLEGAIEKKKIVNILAMAAARIRSELRPSFHEDVLAQLAKELGIDGKMRLDANRFEVTSEELLAKTLVDFSTGAWTVADAMKKIRETSDRQQKRIKTSQDFKEFIVGLAVREITLKNASEAHLDQDTTVQLQIRRKTTEFILKRWADSVQDTVGARGWDESLLLKHYEEKKSSYIAPEEINVGEILLKTKPEAEAVLTQIKNGADFAALARKKSIRLWAAANGGELGFGSKSMYGTLGDTLFKTAVGKVAGPFVVDPYYGIFKIIGRHNSRQKTLDESRPQIEKELTASRKQEVFRQSIEQLRARSSISIHEDVLANIVIN